MFSIRRTATTNVAHGTYARIDLAAISSNTAAMAAAGGSR